MTRRVDVPILLFVTLVSFLASPIVMSGAPPAMAQDAYNAFLTLDASKASRTTFGLDGADELDFTAASPDDFIWNETIEPVDAFDESGLFTDFRQVRFGTDPANRDRGKIRVYAARIVPHTVGLAADYARFLAATWGDLNLGVKAYTPTFGEVMTGRDTSEGRHLTRLSVWRQNESLLIVRTDAPRKDWGFIGPKAAAFLGSLRFSQAMPKDPVFAGFRADEFTIPSVAGRPGTIAPFLPPAWRTLPISVEDPTKGVVRFYVDDADTSESSGAMLYSFDAGSEAVSFDEAKGQGFAEVVLGLLLDNLLPNNERDHDMVSSGRFADLKPITEFNGFYTFKVEFPEIGQPAGITVLVTARGTQVAGFASISAYPTDMVHRAATLHSTLVDGQLRDALKAYWTPAHGPVN